MFNTKRIRALEDRLSYFGNELGGLWNRVQDLEDINKALMKALGYSVLRREDMPVISIKKDN